MDKQFGLRFRRRRVTLVLLVLCGLVAAWMQHAMQPVQPVETYDKPAVLAARQERALDTLALLAVKGRAPKTGYSREYFSSGWGDIGGCSIRELVLQRDLTDVQLHDDGCRVTTGNLADPYTGATIAFVRGQTTSQAVQIDHVVAVSDAWQKGAQELSMDQRYAFYNDSLNLLAVDGPANMNKSDADAASWLPPNKSYRCRYVARQIAVKHKYNLWVTTSEKQAMNQVLKACPDQVLPVVEP